MKKIFDFIRQHKDVALAAVNENGNPTVRVFQIMLIDEAEKNLFFATSPKKEIFKQLKNNPNIEILSFADNISVRISGKAFFDVPDVVCKKIYSENHVLLRLYKQYTDLVYFRLFIKKAEYFNLNFATPIHECFENQQ
jgi:uncharacterized pyridoxamine 5'-phosphate oxidase family protein